MHVCHMQTIKCICMHTLAMFSYAHSSCLYKAVSAACHSKLHTHTHTQTHTRVRAIMIENADCDTFPQGNVQSLCVYVYTCITFLRVDFHMDVIQVHTHTHTHTHTLSVRIRVLSVHLSVCLCCLSAVCLPWKSARRQLSQHRGLVLQTPLWKIILNTC